MDTFVILASLKLRTDRFPLKRKIESTVPICKIGDEEHIRHCSPVSLLLGMRKKY